MCGYIRSGLAINCGCVKLKEKIRHKHGIEVTLVVAEQGTDEWA